MANLRCEYRENPLGIDVVKPRLSWVIEVRGRRSEDRGQRQTAYQVLVASSEELLEQDKGDLWDSGKVESNQSIQVEYAGKPLESRMHCHWKVRVWDQARRKRSPWSAPARWTMGLLEAKGLAGEVDRREAARTCTRRPDAVGSRSTAHRQRHLTSRFPVLLAVM